MRRNYYNYILALSVLGISLTGLPSVSFAEPNSAQMSSTKEAKLLKTYTSIIENHLNKNLSIMRTVRILVNNYPEHASYIVSAAFDLTPNKKKAIIMAAIQAEPAVTYSVVETALTYFPGNAEMIVQTAIETEPAYIDDILSLAIAHSPEKADSLITVTLQNHPSYSESIMRTTHQSASGNLLSSVIGTLKLIPESADYVLNGIKDFFTSLGGTESEAYISKEQWKLLAVEAKNSGLDKDRLQWLVDKGHLEQKELAAVYNK
ncbi:hypothetical protein AWR38_10840 [Idiomarina sp. WRN-38]|uniref:hypothetical protein n=1 Tax=Idiomarina sp. OXR-189 TaxID=3100175 RepID=UPI000733981D|nr:hypothetical protein [Idiomarina sp. OXR-189]KTG30153.1 hypothetical protein AUR68_10825 [Idiomarina sp. H105]OAF14546.1 hypothetical protein AWR38_10840 [Idiomarina sp. WRN-38]WPZ02032.1 hypothetical protein UM402_03735 [Idiomarina sp. OXR-189]|tara:strand:+ start:361 stop:1146 length:786 start_codon:yes stop_codon:yes gene_type:complete